ncbi:MAG: DNA/RNA nuclease SfsA [Firmicutes bacterium]|nr:DNA/RNA nuclease SfsA [Bacillota bacterium]
MTAAKIARRPAAIRGLWELYELFYGDWDGTDRRPHVPFPAGLAAVRIERRANRFTVEARTAPSDPRAVRCGSARPTPLRLHLPNSGRMRELLVPGTLGLASVERRSGRRTDGTLLLVRYRGRWVSVDAHMPNRLMSRCLETGYLPPFRHYRSWRSEVRWGRGRVDFLLDGQPPCLVETKSCNLVENGLALFPDAPTGRGTRHLSELAQAVRDGYRAAVVWFVQRDDARSLAAHRDADPAFADALALARACGVEAYAYRCQVRPEGVTVLDEIPVLSD